MRESFVRLRFRLDHRWAPDRFSAQLDHELSPAQRSRMARHLGECVECRQAFAGLAAVVEAMRRLPPVQPAVTPAQFAASVRVRLAESPGRET
jgi:predicted anti-sigma-YlaC factor YlaD